MRALFEEDFEILAVSLSGPRSAKLAGSESKGGGLGASPRGSFKESLS